MKHTQSELLRWLPCLHVFQAVPLALAPRKLLLGGLALMLLAAGHQLLGRLPFAQPFEIEITAAGNEATFWQEGMKWLGHQSQGLLAPVQHVSHAVLRVFRGGASWPQLADAWTRLVWSLLVWSVFGGALARMTALSFSRGQHPGVFAALKFSIRQCQSSLTAVLIPTVALVLLWGVNALLGLLTFLPVVGPWLLTVVFGINLFLGFLMLLLLLAVVVGWPLMLAAISAENSDGYDGLTRTWGYLCDRTWLAAFLVLLALLAGAIGFALVGLLVGQLEHLTLASTLTFAPETARAEDAPFRYWLLLLGLARDGFVASYFWSAITVVYFVLRLSDDGTPLETVVVETATSST